MLDTWHSGAHEIGQRDSVGLEEMDKRIYSCNIEKVNFKGPGCRLSLLRRV